MSDSDLPPQTLRERIWRIIFLSDTPSGKRFDVLLLWLIGLSVAAVMLESIESFRLKYLGPLNAIELFFTLIFTVEYVTRLSVARRPLRYAFSFFGIVDLVSIMPTYVELFFPGFGAENLAVIRILRILRMFRVFKMARHLGEARVIMNALQASRPKITVFMMAVLSLTLIMGTILYLVEGTSNPGFSSIPNSIYWAIVTVTTVGYGDMTPITPIGKVLSAFMMIIGYAIIAVPTGIVGAELNREMNDAGPKCAECGLGGHQVMAKYCRGCGTVLPRPN